MARPTNQAQMDPFWICFRGCECDFCEKNRQNKILISFSWGNRRKKITFFSFPSLFSLATTRRFEFWALTPVGRNTNKAGKEGKE